jgi:molecular chaperone IbpA
VAPNGPHFLLTRLLKEKTMTRFATLYPQFVGFDQLFNELEKLVEGHTPARSTSFPPHNILKVDDNRFVVEMAVAGFGQDEVDVEIQDGVLIVKGEKKDQSEVDYIYRGIATRSFTKSIRLSDTIEVRGAQFKDGILKIALENIVPDHKKPRKIEFTKELNFSNPKLLQEAA